MSITENPLLTQDWYNIQSIEREGRFIRDALARLVTHINQLPRPPMETRDVLRTIDVDLTAAKIVIGIALGDRDHVAVLQDHNESNRHPIAAE